MTKKTYYYIANYSKKGKLTSFLELDDIGLAIASHIPRLYENKDRAIDDAENSGLYDYKAYYWHVRKVEIEVPEMTKSEMDEIDGQ